MNPLRDPVVLIGGGLIVLVAALLLYPGLNADDEHVSRISMEQSVLIVALRAYRSEYGIYPTGNWTSISRALTGENSKKELFVEWNKKNTAPDGTLLDPWDTPFEIYFSGEKMLIRSAGPNKQFDDTGPLPRNDDVFKDG